MSPKALVVGGAGATGRHIVAGLAARGYEVTILHRGVHEPPHLAPYRHIHADPHFPESVAQALGRESFDAVLLTYGRIRGLAPLFSGRCARLVAIGGIPIYPGFADASSRFPGGTALLAREDGEAADASAFSNPEAAAFVSKMAAAERAVMDAHEAGGYRASIVRYPRLYGPGNVVSHEWSVARRALDGRPFILLPNGGQGSFTRCAAENAAHCVLLALGNPAAEGEVFNCGDDEQFSLAQWVQVVLGEIGAQMEIVGLPSCLNHVADHFALYGGSMFHNALVDTGKARRLLGYADVVPSREAIARTVRWWVDHLSQGGGEGMIRRDRFDYGLEDRVHDSLKALKAAFPLAPREDVPFHSYPHPKTPSLQPDHLGR